MTPFWKEERYGYNIYQNEQKHIFLALTPPIPLNRKNDIHVRSPSLLRRLDNGSRWLIPQSISLDAASFISWVLQYIITPLHKDAFDKGRQSMRA